MADLWQRVLDHRERLSGSGELAARRREQQVKWMWAMLDERFMSRLKTDPALKAKLPRIEAAVGAGTLSPMLAVEEIGQALGL
jgi:GTPase